MGNFKKLHVWILAKGLAVEIYEITRSHSFEKDFRLRDQIRSAAISISSNIAEGDELDTNRQSIRHFYIAKGSCAELMTQLIISKEIGYINEKIEMKLTNKINQISIMLRRLIQARS
jgi:four helix bundle protein